MKKALVFLPGLDYDWINERLYFSDYGTKLIGLTHLDGSNTSVLIRGLDRPRGLAVHPCRSMTRGFLLFD